MNNVVNEMLRAMDLVLSDARELSWEHDPEDGGIAMSNIHDAEKAIEAFKQQMSAEVVGTVSAALANSDGIVGMTAKQRKVLLEAMDFIDYITPDSGYGKDKRAYIAFMLEWEFPQLWAEATEEEE